MVLLEYMKKPTTYKVRATRREDGSYTLSYGKGQKKITAVTVRDPANNKWFVDVLGHRRKISDIKKEWGDWANKVYSGTSKASSESVPEAPAQFDPPSSSTLTPMRMKQGGDYGLKVYASDPNDPRFRKDEHATPLGMLLEVQAWCERYKERIEAINKNLAAQRTPGFNPFSFLRMMIDECIEREIPEYKHDCPYYTKDDETDDNEQII